MQHFLEMTQLDTATVCNNMLLIELAAPKMFYRMRPGALPASGPHLDPRPQT